MRLYLDTSVLAAYYCPEPLSGEVQVLLSEAVKPALSLLTEVELFSAVARKVRAGEIGSADGGRILSKFTAHVASELFTILPIKDYHWELARNWIGLFTAPLRTLDALHLSIASAEELEMITADRSLHRAAETLGVSARLLGR